jgi:hypothetical protein
MPFPAHLLRHARPRLAGRRDFLAGCAGLIAAPFTPGAFAGITADAGARFLSARQLGHRHEAVLLDPRGRDLAALGLPDRGHSFAVDTARARAVIFGRQPGFYAQEFTLPDCRPGATLPLPADRHFFGHGVFCADGTRLFATENDFEAGRGVLGVYAAHAGAAWTRLGEFDTGGIGPHEVVLLPDGATLCVANGGLLTHPDYGKTPLNLATMRPSLAYIDAADGRLLESVQLHPSLFQLSIRHLAVDATGAVWFACQHQGPATEQPPLLGRHRRGAAPQLLAGPPQVQRELRNYVGSIAIDADAGIVATSSPVGGSVAFWDATHGQCLGSARQPDGCGVAALGNAEFIVSDGSGSLVAVRPDGEARRLLAGSAELAWDNHLRRA